MGIILKLRRSLGTYIYRPLLKIGIYSSWAFARKRYWQNRVVELDNIWREEQDDFALLQQIITQIRPFSLLEIGCGSGRIFPLYHSLQISEIVGQDIAQNALQLAKKRFPFIEITLTNSPLIHLAYPNHYFDLIISNRVLQHIPPNKVEQVIRKLTELGKHVYVNEMSDRDDTHAFYLFKHDYCALFEACHFKCIQQGYLGRKKWHVFAGEYCS